MELEGENGEEHPVSIPLPSGYPLFTPARTGCVHVVPVSSWRREPQWLHDPDR